MLRALKTTALTFGAVVVASAAAAGAGVIINGAALRAECLADIHACRGSTLSDIVDSIAFLGVMTAFIYWRYRVEVKRWNDRHLPTATEVRGILKDH